MYTISVLHKKILLCIAYVSNYSEQKNHGIKEKL